MFGLSSIDILIILFVVIFMFGGKRLPKLARGAGDIIRATWKGVNNFIDKI